MWEEKTDASIADSNVNQPRIQKLIRVWRLRRQSRGGVHWVAQGWLLQDLSGSCVLLPYSCSILGVYTFILENLLLTIWALPFKESFASSWLLHQTQAKAVYPFGDRMQIVPRWLRILSLPLKLAFHQTLISYPLIWLEKKECNSSIYCIIV